MSGSEDKLSRVPRVRDGIDLTKAGLSVEEGFLASRIDGRASVRDLSYLVGKSPEDTLRSVERLASVGVVRLAEPGTTDLEEDKARQTQSVDLDDHGDYIFPPHLMMEEADLSEAERKRIIWYHENLETWTHYELLRTRRRDDAKVIKRAYFERSKEWHPDRFRRPNLGSFRPMIDRIFKQVQEAYRVLSDPDRRAAYDEENILMAGEDEIAEMLAHQRKQDREARRKDEAEQRRKKRNPMRQRIAKAKKLFADAQQMRENGQLMDALRAAQTAHAFDPRDEYEALTEKLKTEAGEFRIQPLLKRGTSQENLTNWAEAIEMFQEAVRVAPEHGLARVRLAYNMSRGRRDPHDALGHAQKGVSLLPEDPEAHFVLGLCYEEAGMEKAAIRAYSKAVELKSNHTDAKKRLRALKWGF